MLINWEFNSFVQALITHQILLTQTHLLVLTLWVLWTKMMTMWLLQAFITLPWVSRHKLVISCILIAVPTLESMSHFTMVLTQLSLELELSLGSVNPSTSLSQSTTDAQPSQLLFKMMPLLGLKVKQRLYCIDQLVVEARKTCQWVWCSPTLMNQIVR